MRGNCRKSGSDIIRAIISIVLRQDRGLKGRVIGISMLMALTTEMLTMGLCDADSLKYSMEKQAWSSNFQAYFMIFSRWGTVPRRKPSCKGIR